MIYLASPYSHPNMSVMHHRYAAARAAIAWYFNQGYFVYSPIAHCHDAAMHHELPTDFQFWSNYNFHMIEHSDTLHILTIDGWKESKGVRGELDFARALGKPVYEFNPLIKQVLEYVED